MVDHTLVVICRQHVLEVVREVAIGRTVGDLAVASRGCNGAVDVFMGGILNVDGSSC
jgi:hypothetical protein